MKKLLLIATVLFYSIIQAQNDYTLYPDYNTVVDKFFDNYSVKRIPATDIIKIEKRPKGWYIVVTDIYDNTIIHKNELLWSMKKKKFEQIDFNKIGDKEDNKEQADKFKAEWHVKFFRICPYYGYPGWDWDVIQDYKNATNLPDSITYALGRAYSSYAGNLINNNSGWADLKNLKHHFDLPKGKNCMNTKQLKKYRYYRHQAIDRFNVVVKANPNFETIVGDIGVKTANEYVTSFLDLRIYQNESEANKELADSIYSDFYIAAAKNYLNSCAPNAILFTNGDNDTYPLLYVQSKYRFRTDVVVVNLSLLNTDRYINHLRDSIIGTPGIPISFSREDIEGDKRNVIIMEDDNSDFIEAKKLIDFIKNDNNKKNYGVIDYHYVPTNKFSLTYNEKVMEWIPKEHYFFKSHLMLLDILVSNNFKRPVYMAITVGSASFFGLEEYFQLEGFAYRVIPEKKKIYNGQIGSVDTEIMYNNIIKRFDWNGLGNIKSNQKLICMNYRNNFHRLAESLINENKFDSAGFVLKRCIELIPNEKLYFDFFMIPFIEDFYKLGEFETGNKVAETTIYNLQNDIHNYEGMYWVRKSDNIDAALNEIKNILEKYNQKETIQLLEYE